MSLEDIREKKHSKVTYVVIGLLLLGMAGFGTSQFGTGGGASRQALLSAGDAEISVNEYENMLRYLQQSNPTLGIDQARALAIAGLKQRLSLADYLNRYPFAASNEQINSEISNDPTFFENGKFSEAVFRKKVPVSPEIYRHSVSNSLALEDFQVAIVGTGIVSEAELQPYLAMQQLSYDITVAKIPANRFTATADEKDIEAYYNTHKDELMTEEKYQIDYIDFDPKTLAKDVKISEEEIAAKLAPPRQAAYYLFKDKAAAQSAFEQIAKGQKMATLAPTLGDTIEDSGDLGELTAVATADALIPQSAIDAIFALNNVGDVTAPITVDSGVYLFELSKKTDAVSSDTAKAQARQALQQQKAAPEITEIGEKLNQAVFETATPSLETIHEATQLPIQSSSLVSASNPQSILGVAEVLAAIEKSDKTVGKLQEPIIIGNRVIIYRFTDVEKPQQKPLSAVKDQVEQAVIAEKIQQQIKTTAKQLVKKTQKEGLISAAKADNYPTQHYSDFKGSVADNGVLDPIAALLIAQQSPRQEKATEIQSPMGDAYVYVTDEIRLGKTAADAEAKQQLSKALSAEIGNVELNDLLMSITQRTKMVDRSAELLNQTNQ